MDPEDVKPSRRRRCCAAAAAEVPVTPPGAAVVEKKLPIVEVPYQYQSNAWLPVE